MRFKVPTKSFKIIWMALVFFSIAEFTSSSSRAAWTPLPESRHQLYDAWGLLLDQQSTLLNFGQARVWTGLGGAVPIIGNDESLHHPQFLIHASANAALHYNDNFRIWTETLDVRIGLAFQWELDEHLRFSLGYTHFSGHSADGISSLDLNMVEPSVGLDSIPVRAVYDMGKMFRFVGTVKPFVRSDPSVFPVWFDESAEFYPWGAKDDSHRFSPYASVGLEETGIKGQNIILGFHGQLGVYMGNHFSGGHFQTIRLVTGYYTGADPRLKYMALRNATQQFFYLGTMFDL